VNVFSSVSSVSLVPVRAYTNSKLIGNCTYTGIQAYYRWYRNNTINTSGVSNTTGNIANLTATFRANDVWKFSCLANSGTLNSTWSNSSGRIMHITPAVSNVTISPTIVYKDTTMIGDCNYNGSTLYFKWYKNGILNQSSTGDNSIKSGMLKGQNWTFSCKASDGIVNSSWVNSSVKTISNTNPTTPTLTYPPNLAMINKPYTWLNWTASDLDGDSLTYYLFFGNTTRVYKGSLPRFNISGLVDSTYYRWYVIASDGISNSSNSSTRLIYVSLNKPAIANVNPTNASWVTSLNTNITFTATDNNGIDKCRLYINDSSGTYGLNQTKSSVVSGARSYFYLTVQTNKNYKFNIWCNNTLGVSTYYIKNTTFYTDNTLPSLSVYAPENNTEYNSKTLDVNISSTDEHMIACTYTLMYASSRGIRSNGYLNCTGVTTISTPFYSAGYILRVSSTDQAQNSRSKEYYFTAVAQSLIQQIITPGGGGGGAIEQKVDCAIDVDKDITISSDGIAEIVVTNKGTGTYNPALSITEVTGTLTQNVELTNSLPTILPGKKTSFGVKVNDVSDVTGTFKVTLSDANCKDVVLTGTIGKTANNNVDILEQLGSGKILEFLTSPINYAVPYLQVWMLGLTFFFIGIGFSFKWMGRLFKESELLVLIAWVFVLLLICFGLLTIPATMLIRMW
jgi:hypothetical protein